MKRASLVPILACAVVNRAGAAGWVPLVKNTRAEVFDDEDLHLFLDAGAKALASDTPGATVDWSNPATGAGGRFEAVGPAPAVKGLPCKRLRMTVYAHKRAEKSSGLTACRTAEGRWKLAGVR